MGHPVDVEGLTIGANIMNNEKDLEKHLGDDSKSVFVVIFICALLIMFLML
jgi:hypothetical protein